MVKPRTRAEMVKAGANIGSSIAATGRANHCPECVAIERRQMPETKTIRVVLIDDHFTVHKTVSALLDRVPDVKLVGQGANGREALDLCARVHPDVVLMDVVMPVMDGIEATERMRERFPSVKVLVLSSFQDHESVYAMLRSGAVGYLTKGTLSQDLVETIRVAA
jgi:DNA-binding NarL/FixJ family response regulator